MGRIKTKPVKSITAELIDKNFNEFSDKFEFNKKIVENHTEILSKKLRNIVTGYVTRQVRARSKI